MESVSHACLSTKTAENLKSIDKAEKESQLKKKKDWDFVKKL